MAGRGKEFDPQGNERSAPQRQTVWQVCPHWYDEEGLFYADAHEERFHGDQRAAWAVFHHCVEIGRKPGRVNFTVDLLTYDLARNSEGKWVRDGMQEMLDRWPGGIPAEFNSPARAEARRRVAEVVKRRTNDGSRLADPCKACQGPATSYTPDGEPFCERHLPKEQVDA